MYRKFRSVLNLCAIFSAKLGSIVVSVVFLPVFNKLFGAEDFGIITLIISLQTLLITLDLGMSILVGRDAAYETHDKFYNTLKSSEKLIFFIYLILTLFAVVFTFISHDFELTIKVLLACVLFFSLTLQNIYYSSLNGRQEYISNAISQLAASFSRAIITLSVVYYIETSIVAFLLAQCVVSLVNLVFVRLFLIKKYPDFDNKSSASFSDIKDIAKRGKALMLYGMAGAAIMQLDKSLISIINGPQELGPYFLAFSFCMLPISALATPIVQFFQPKLLSSFSSNDELNMCKNCKHFSLTLAFFVVLPSLVVYIFSHQVVSLWLGKSDNVSLVYEYIKIMMPGIIVGSIGYIPVVFMLLLQDYRFQAKVSWITCVVVLSLVAYFSYIDRVDYICYLYSAYFIITTIICWVRTVRSKAVTKYSYLCLRYSYVSFIMLAITFTII
ncbi:lipopolysaccharide biosynthesis protein [Vibrio vulnificus]|uniref:lipopolysaccharide biosynthesis protein n=1 Tax=Vibrio vulnificus TaxID=672 RepID=UPI0005081307|nr:oligosaccharide flippase family protein [Vibrio vulnificus]ASJ39827.1 hypothetical protein VVCECT4999_14425 [Vibrio vulnificus]EGR0354188.1 hypothetical protein [Vibrio vulnificus]EGR0641543.1 hypothetical protein [Vibrio vulnificus]EHK9000770.1 oligosaccharide flippase family protein [Vibrio vulnificus]EID4443829.1 oligosaccharide flippase family protein [Vibrio vulnificus]